MAVKRRVRRRKGAADPTLPENRMPNRSTSRGVDAQTKASAAELSNLAAEGATKSLGEGGQLDPTHVQGIVVGETPNPSAYTGPEQKLHYLGVVNTTYATQHAEGIRIALQALGWTIKRSKIESGPGVTVMGCRESVMDNANAS